MSDITEILSSDQVSDSRAVINENFDNLNTDKLEKTNNLSDVSSAATARTNLGLDSILDAKADVTGTDPVSITIADGADDVPLTITQNDVTNKPYALQITDATGNRTAHIEGTSATNAGPWLEFFHNSASPAADDFITDFDFIGRDDAGNHTTYADMHVRLIDPTNGSEDARVAFQTRLAGSLADRFSIGNSINGVNVGASSAAGVVSSNGNQDLVLQTGNATTGNITITDGANGDITLTPNGSGSVIVDSIDISGDVITAPGAGGLAGFASIAAGNGDSYFIIYDDSFDEITRFTRGGGSNVNEVTISANTTSNAPSIAATGGDSNISLNLIPKGTGEVQVSGEQILTEALIKRIYKSADETVNNSAVLQDDDHLSFAVAANEVWAFTAILIVNSGGTPDFQYTFTAPAGATGGFDPYNSSASNITDFGSALIAATGVANQLITVAGTIINSSNAGNLQLQWAQNTQDASDTKVLKGSYIIAHRLA